MLDGFDHRRRCCPGEWLHTFHAYSRPHLPLRAENGLVGGLAIDIALRRYLSPLQRLEDAKRHLFRIPLQAIKA
jgi:hypothetical protein